MKLIKKPLDLRWSNPNRDQELEKANAKLVETQQKQAQVMSRLQDILTKAYPTDMAEKKFSSIFHLVVMQCMKSLIRIQGKNSIRLGTLCIM